MMVQSLRGIGDVVIGPDGLPVTVDTGSSVNLDFSQGYAAAPGAPGSSTTYTSTLNSGAIGIPGFNLPLNTSNANAPLTKSLAASPTNLYVILAFVLFGVVFISRK